MSCGRSDHDQNVVVRDYGPKGLEGLVSMKLTNGLTPGGSITVVVSTKHEYVIGVYHGKDEQIFYFNGRPHRDQIVLNSFLNGKWGAEEEPKKGLIQMNVRDAITIVYEATGYRVFINGIEQHFYKHRCDKSAEHVECNFGTCYKIIYMAPAKLVS